MYILQEDRKQAIDYLKKKYENIKDETESSMIPWGENFWVKYLKILTFQALIEQILDKYLSEEYQKNPIRLTLLEEKADNGLRLKVEVKKNLPVTELWKPGTTIFALNQVFKCENEKLIVHIETVTATGNGKKLFKESLLPLFETFNVQKITLKASGIGGGREGVLVWARYGFIPSQENWNEMLESGKKQIKEIQDTQEKWIEEMNSILADLNPRTIRKLVFLSWQEKEKVKPILDNMLESTVSWSGTLNLADKIDRDWITKYTSGADIQEYSDLLK
ncbi:hypothetical protein WA1_26030 [Scytonema hofmannii PCC 7110]|uniref:Uncharacterized protein n=1 Tax=Scytonema hofmannii PCC 7110 TaxID=128403 RepID=A0A139X7B8_9CYAN|nr:hypothetical protein [Scytonema hofmannii]KYC40580.1 hypothetical protein WA1_26030 [Scytonema hofmannii PCC 7110]